MSWTDERIEQLTKMWESGATASQIADELGGVSRNAVIGKAHRLGLKARPSPVKANERPDDAAPAAAAVAEAPPEVAADAPATTVTPPAPTVPLPEAPARPPRVALS
ncbi:MAG: GcrA cell cycle regulator, partial [Sphingomonadales bacterium]|nr:GcrA cell cycle regulator [Sphingomonadales bacterium]